MIFQLVSQTTDKQVHHTVDSFDLFPHVTGRLTLKGASNITERIVSVAHNICEHKRFTFDAYIRGIIGTHRQIICFDSHALYEKSSESSSDTFS